MSHDSFQIQKGHFYALGVGPGSPDLLTLRAVDVIRNSGVILCPRSAVSRDSLALEIIRDHIFDQEIIEHVYPMQRSETKVRESWLRASEIIAFHCLRGRTVAQVTLGDPHIYSTCAYVLPVIEKALGPGRTHIIPGITAFQSCAANFTQSLTTQEDRLTLMPGTDMAEVEKAIGGCETLVLYKTGRKLQQLFDLLKRQGLERHARVVFNSGMPGKEKIYQDLEQALEDEPGYLACVLIYTGRRKWD